MDRALRANLLAKSGKAVEVAGDVDTLLLDKTGTITIGNRKATRFVPLGRFSEQELGRLASLASFSDPTPEGKSIVELFAAQKNGGGGVGEVPPRKLLEEVSATSAILSAVIFNAIIIPLLIPIALKGVTYRPVGADALLRRNLLVWGLGGVVLPFIGIKLIDLVLTAVHLA